MTLKDFLATNELTQEQFATRSQVPQQTIASILAGGGTRAKTAKKIIIATGGLVTLDDLIGESEESSIASR